MKNVEIALEGTVLTLKVDLTQEFGLSSSGKSIIVATTEGAARLNGRDEVVTLTVYKKF